MNITLLHKITREKYVFSVDEDDINNDDDNFIEIIIRDIDTFKYLSEKLNVFIMYYDMSILNNEKTYKFLYPKNTRIVDSDNIEKIINKFFHNYSFHEKDMTKVKYCDILNKTKNFEYICDDI